MTAFDAPPMIEARNLEVRYPGAAGPAIRGITCASSAGRLLAVAGPNGSGKTTLLRALTGAVAPSAGEAAVGGRAAHHWPPRELARVIAVVGQREEITFPLSVSDTVMLGRYARLGPLGSPGAADHAAVSAALVRCDLSGLAHRGVDTLSGGEWQRVRLARALAQEPRALLLDEPSAALDVRHEMELFELVRSLVDGGIAGLVVTHHLNLAARYADEVLLLDRGSVVARGTPAEVFREDVLSRVFEWPLAVTQWRGVAPQLTPLRPGEAAR